MKHD